MHIVSDPTSAIPQQRLWLVCWLAGVAVDNTVCGFLRENPPQIRETLCSPAFSAEAGSEWVGNPASAISFWLPFRIREVGRKEPPPSF